VNACKEYAQNAVNQFHALDGAGCQGAPGDKLWSGNYDEHFNWCMSSNGDLGHQFKRRWKAAGRTAAASRAFRPARICCRQARRFCM
jgi:hypothetical protein